MTEEGCGGTGTGFSCCRCGLTTGVVAAIAELLVGCDMLLVELELELDLELLLADVGAGAAG